ncbi:tRNA maturation protein LHP1 [Aspergillus lucknowensis]|uniref:RNA-binding La domain protein n=1 Tax=Aspergillus lucknowensis TaxID=176173 RepID=A0ABR4LLC1_9EURO
MAEEQKAAAAQALNSEAEKDVQQTLAELKGEVGASTNGTEKKEEVTADMPKEDAEEARIVAAAAKLGEQSEKAEKETKTEGRQQDYRSRRRNHSKFDPSAQKETDDPVEIRKQVEFYFSDSNLPMDKFLFSKVGGNKNHAVPLELLHSFKRMRRFQPFSAIVEALKSSETLELTDNETAVRRKVPLPESVKDVHDPSVVKVFEDEAMARSIYAKGFGEEQPTTQLDIEAFFAPYGPINAIRLRRSNDKYFKGSVFVEFASEEKQKAFLDLDPKPQWKGQDLLIKSKKEYCDEKVADIEAGRIKPSSSRGRGGSRGGRGGNRRDNNRDWRERRAEDQKRGFRNDRDQRSERREVQKDSRGVPVVQSTAEPAGQKRTREEEEANGDHPAKKVDSKEQ